MMRPLFFAAIVAGTMTLSTGSSGFAARDPERPDVDALLQRLDDLYRSKSSIARIQIDVTTARSTRTMRLNAWTRGEEEVLVLIEAPAREAGTATLRVGNNLWNYLPRIARTIRIPPAAMLGSWMSPTSRMTTWSRNLRCGKISPPGSTTVPPHPRGGG
jgi:hypothetical protein